MRVLNTGAFEIFALKLIVFLPHLKDAARRFVPKNTRGSFICRFKRSGIAPC